MKLGPPRGVASTSSQQSELLSGSNCFTTCAQTFVRFLCFFSFLLPCLEERLLRDASSSVLNSSLLLSQFTSRAQLRKFLPGAPLPMNQLYDLKGYKPGRRAGLTAAGYKGPRLLQIINHPITPKINPDDMPPKTYTRSSLTKKASINSNTNDSTKENIEAPPESSSDEASDRENAADIKPQE